MHSISKLERYNP